MNSPSIIASKCIFRQPWWLESLHDNDEWGETHIELRQGKCATLPYVIKKKFGFRILTMPPLTQTAGPLLIGTDYKDNRNLALEKDLTERLIECLPPHDMFNQNFHWSVTNWLPWHWKGYTQSTRYTYRIDDLSDLEKIYSRLMPNIKSDIKKATDRFSLQVHSEYDINKFLDLNEMVFKRQAKKLPYRRELVHNLETACANQDCRKIFFVEDGKGKVHAAIYIVWDEQSAYYLMSGADPKLRSSGATSLAIWEAIKFSSSVTKSFDFEGSMIEPVERFFRGFGAKQTPYFNIKKINSRLLKSLYCINDLYSF